MPTDDPAEQARLNAANIAYIESPSARDAYRLLMAEAETRDIETSVLASNGAKTLRFYRELEGERSYFFSCDRTRTYLRCYVRPSSLRVWPELRRILLDDADFEAVEVSGEVQVVLHDPERCLRLVDLLFDRSEAPVGATRGASDRRSFDLVADAMASTDGFADWYGALTRAVDGGTDGGLLPGTGMGFRRLKPVNGNELRVEFWIGDGTSSAVQINEPSVPGTENPLGGVAVDGEGRRHVVRQGVLHRNNASERIQASEFEARTGLAPLDMRVEGRVATRQWHIVTPLDGLSDAAIAANTAEFVARCWQARGWDERARADEERLYELFGANERGGWFDYVPDPSPRSVLRAQGEVWQALSRQLASEGIELSKPRHARGYEVDAVVEGGGQSLLVEIKSGIAAADYYCGVGQLMVYAALFPRLSDHRKVLLLPEERVTGPLEDTLRPLKIAVHRYRLSRTPTIEVRFSTAFLTLCGLSGKGAARFDSF